MDFESLPSRKIAPSRKLPTGNSFCKLYDYFPKKTHNGILKYNLLRKPFLIELFKNF